MANGSGFEKGTGTAVSVGGQEGVPTQGAEKGNELEACPVCGEPRGDESPCPACGME